VYSATKLSPFIAIENKLIAVIRSRSESKNSKVLGKDVFICFLRKNDSIRIVPGNKIEKSI
jgi:hypothetical protein